MNLSVQTELIRSLAEVNPECRFIDDTFFSGIGRRAEASLVPGWLFIAGDLLEMFEIQPRRSSDLSSRSSDSDHLDKDTSRRSSDSHYVSIENPEKLQQLRDLLLLLQLSLFQGNLCISSRPDDILDLLLRMGISTEVGTPTAESLAKLVSDPDLELYLRPLFDTRILVRKTTSRATYLYPGRQWRAVERIRNFAIKQRARTDAFKEGQLRQWFTDILVKRPIMGGKNPIAFTPEQRLALLLGLTEPLFVLSGGPGTGKTTIILNLLRLIIRSGVPAERIRLAAPTGKAAARMMESIMAGLKSIENPTDDDRSIQSIKSSTLHGLLGIKPGAEKPEYTADNPIDADVVIVDEVSMVDAVMMSSLLTAIDGNITRLILLGDRDQLPSVDSGAVLADLVALLSEEGEAACTEDILQLAARVIGPDEEWKRARKKSRGPNRYVHLTHSHRSEKAVRELAFWINSGGNGRSPLQPAESAKFEDLRNGLEGTFLISQPEGDAAHTDLKSLIHSWAENVFTQEWDDLLKQISQQDAPRGKSIKDPEVTELIRKLFSIFNASRVLTVLRRGPLGAEHVQRLFQRAMLSREPRYYRGLFSGLPVLILRNDPLRGLANGDTGLILQFRSKRFLAVFDGNPMVIFSPEVLPMWEPAYAMTVHKSQGSEYTNVLLILPDKPDHPLMSRQILYTGVTRARKSVFLYGSEHAIERAARTALRRITGLD